MICNKQLTMKVRNKKQSSPKFCQYCEKEIFYPRLKFCSMRCCNKKASFKEKEIEMAKKVGVELWS